MSTHLRSPLTFAHFVILLASTSAAQSEPTKPETQKLRKDRYGDPLPPGASQRLGTIRWRHDDWIKALKFSNDGKTILSASGGSLCFWDRVTGTQKRELEEDTRKILQRLAKEAPQLRVRHEAEATLKRLSDHKGS